MVPHADTGDWPVTADHAARIQLRLQENEETFEQCHREGTLELGVFLKEEHQRLENLLAAYWTLRQTPSLQQAVLSIPEPDPDQRPGRATVAATSSAAVSSNAGPATGTPSKARVGRRKSEKSEKPEKPEKTYRCPICDHKSKKPNHYNDHRKTHVGTKCFWVGCKYTAGTEKEVIEHIHKKHVESNPSPLDEKYKCAWLNEDEKPCNHTPYSQLTSVKRVAYCHSYDRGVELGKITVVKPIEEVADGRGGGDQKDQAEDADVSMRDD